MPESERFVDRMTFPVLSWSTAVDPADRSEERMVRFLLPCWLMAGSLAVLSSDVCTQSLVHLTHLRLRVQRVGKLQRSVPRYSNQYPIEVLKEHGAGIVICVECCPDYSPVCRFDAFGE